MPVPKDECLSDSLVFGVGLSVDFGDVAGFLERCYTRRRGRSGGDYVDITTRASR